MEPDYTLEDLTPEEAKAIQEELTAVLLKYNCDMTVSSRIEILKRVTKTDTQQTPNGVQTEQIEETTEVQQTDSSN